MFIWNLVPQLFVELFYFAHPTRKSSMWTTNFILRMTCRVMLLLLLIVHLSSCVHNSTNSTCTRNPQSCLPPHTVARIAELVKCCLYVKEVTLPYNCYIFHPRTIPREHKCEQCSQPEFGCLNDHGRGESWQRVCDFFCPPLSNNSVVNATSSNQQVSEPNDSGSKTSKIVIIVFCLLILAMPCFIVVVIIFEIFRRYRSHTRSRNNSSITRLDFTVLQYLYTTYL